MNIENRLSKKTILELTVDLETFLRNIEDLKLKKISLINNPKEAIKLETEINSLLFKVDTIKLEIEEAEKSKKNIK